MVPYGTADRDELHDLMISPSGIRGIWGAGLSPEVAKAAALAFARYTGAEMIVARDTRPSGSRLVEEVIAGFKLAGSPVSYVGIVPTPVAIWYARKTGRAGVVVSGSHNEPQWNGLKFFMKGGMWPTDEQVAGYVGLIKKQDTSPQTTEEAREEDALGPYVRFILDNLEHEAIKKRRPKVVVDAAGGAGAVATPLILSSMGARVSVINGKLGAFTRRMEPVPSALGALAEAVRSNGASVGFAHDCDADRLTLVDENGNALQPDLTLALVSDNVLSTAGPGSKIVVNVASSRIFQDIASARRAELVFSRVGEGHVVRKIIDVNAVVGGEGSSGGVIMPSLNLTRDGVLASGLITQLVASGKSVASFASGLKRYHSISERLPRGSQDLEWTFSQLSQMSDGATISRLDGVRLDWPDGWGLLRASNTEPVFLIVAEAETRERAEQIFSMIRQTLLKGRVAPLSRNLAPSQLELKSID
ncbi:MAG: hypothetical protein ACP5UI_03145 [Thermoprotei archaeon]|nr:hypothetical protein [TACK group archaeon]